MTNARVNAQFTHAVCLNEHKIYVLYDVHVQCKCVYMMYIGFG